MILTSKKHAESSNMNHLVIVSKTKAAFLSGLRVFLSPKALKTLSSDVVSVILKKLSVSA